jgi:hypothetical protein
MTHHTRSYILINKIALLEEDKFQMNKSRASDDDNEKKDFNDDFILEIEIIKRARDESPLNKIHVALRVLQLLSFMAMTSMVVFIPDCSAMNILDTYAFLV